MSQYSTGSARGVGAMDGGPLTAVAGIALLFNLVGLYAFTGVALCVLGYVILTLVLSDWAGRSVNNSGSADAGNAVMILSWIVALVGGVLVGGFHCVQWSHTAYVVLGVYAISVLIWLLGRAYDAVWSWLFASMGVAMVMAVMHLGSPPGADDMEKAENWTPVTVTAVDESGRPIEGATVYLDLLHFWQSDPKLDGDRKWWSKRETEKDGVAKMDLHEDPRFKRLVIRVRREPFAGGYNEPDTIGKYVGYDDLRRQVVLPSPKLPYFFEVELAQRKHPESAFVAIELNAPVSSDEVISRSLKVALTTESRLPWHDDGRSFNETAVANTGVLRDVSLSGSQRMVFKLNRDLAGRPLTLHVLERDPSRYDDAYRLLGSAQMEPIALGDEYTLQNLVLPSRAAAWGTPAVSDGGSSDRR